MPTQKQASPRYLGYLAAVSSAVILAGCSMTGPHIAEPHELEGPAPYPNNESEFLAPYTAAGDQTEWVVNILENRTSTEVGRSSGDAIGEYVAEHIPMMSDWLNAFIASTVARSSAVYLAGGEDVMLESSDQSFDNVADLAVWMYASYGDTQHYEDVLWATMSVYPDLQEEYRDALIDATADQVDH